MTTSGVMEAAPLAWERRRGTSGMLLFIATEASLFLMLFFAYFYLGHSQPHWPPHPPKLLLALVMLAVLMMSSGVLHYGEGALRQGRSGFARASIGVTILLGIAFLVIQAAEYRERLKELSPTTDAYGSIFYTITSIHAVHLALGLLMLAFVAALPALEPTDRPPHRPMHNAALYWHFVDGVWVVIVALLYALPHIRS